MTTAKSAGKHGTLVVLCGDPLAAANRRPQLMQTFAKQFTRCVLVCPLVEIESIEFLEDIGFEHVPVDFSNQGINPLRDLTLTARLASVFRQVRPDHLFAFHMKPILFGSLASRLAKVPLTHFLFAGLGVLFQDTVDTKRQLIRLLVTRGLKIGLGRATNIFVQNPDDRITLTDAGAVTAASKVSVLNGSGVPLDQFSCDPPTAEGPVRFTMITRVLKSKGVFEFCRAAEAVQRQHPEACQFTLVGPLDTGPDGIPREELEPWIKSGLLSYAGNTSDVRTYLRGSSVCVLPSYYMEGTPRGLLEALAAGRAIITTDSRGCRETVDDGRNGFLVTPRDVKSLTAAMRQFIENRRLITQMGAESRALAESRYDVRLVNQQMLSQMGLY